MGANFPADSPLIESLKSAMPYIRLYRGSTFVLKIGGGIIADKEALDGFARQVALLDQLSIHCVLVHGGGPQATKMQERLGVASQVIAGRRVTDDDTLDIVKMVYGGTLNLDVLSALRRSGVHGVGISGIDGGLIHTVRRAPISVPHADGEERETDFGHVGDVTAEQIDAKLLSTLANADFVPVIASLAADTDGNILNVNADTLACELAIALQAKKMVFLTEAPGLMRDIKDPLSLVPFADPADIEAMKKDGGIQGGMLPKIKACVRAATNGVKRTHIINGLTPDSLLTELFTAEGCGTMIVGEREKVEYQEHG
ncbi:MAG: acetylglutamate kinase [Deltaproteobacteria bacterium]|nr:acetylglutamate kinase [bacterium]MCB9479947.1 acetylglutamate kinase [Deltaproteobacteria bacterium]MCB9489760.1 acetylglutamate kinase [Deltaproteobacteria bacterium]